MISPPRAIRGTQRKEAAAEEQNAGASPNTQMATKL